MLNVDKNALLNPAHRPESRSARSIFAWCCVLALLIALATPIAQAPIVGSITILGLESQEKYVFFVIVALAAVGAYLRRYPLCALSGAIAICYILYYVFKLEQTKARIVSSLNGNLFAGLATSLAGTVHAEWGIWVIIIASIGLVSTLYLRHDANDVPALVASNRHIFIDAAAALAAIAVAINLLPQMLKYGSDLTR